MTGKLIKYEFRSILKIMGIVWTALLALALLAGLFDFITFRQADQGAMEQLADLASAITSFMYGCIFAALIAVTILVVLMRFYKGLLRDEGYLMHTLPVKTWQLITAKGVVAACVSLISIAVATVSILILLAFDGGLEYFGDFMRDVFRVIGQEPVVLAIGLEAVLLGICCMTASIYKAYAAMSIGQLAQKHRIALSVGAWIGIGVLFLLLMSVVGNLPYPDALVQWIGGLGDRLLRGEPERATQAGLWLFIVIEAVQIVIFHVVSEQILRRKLNLE